MIGRKSFSRRSSRIFGSTFVTSPTNPMSPPSVCFLRHFSRPPSLPLIPTAFTPRDSTMATSSLFTFARTISAISIVSLSVTRRPLINFGSIPTLPTQRLISLPPPWTMIGLNPTNLRRVTSWMTLAFNSSSTMALPPYFTTITLRLNLWIYGRASISTSALSRYFCIAFSIFWSPVFSFLSVCCICIL